jgi:hypothetical protein
MKPFPYTAVAVLVGMILVGIAVRDDLPLLLAAVLVGLIALATIVRAWLSRRPDRSARG